MELVESYVQEVAQFLPIGIRHEVTQDLRTSIAEEVFAVADEAGREPNRDDQITVLSRFGHPLKVASQYQPPRALIGADLYPIFVHTMKIVFAIGIGIQVLVILINGLATGSDIGVMDLLSSSINMFFWLFGVTLLVFISIEFSGEKLRLYSSWRPEKLTGTSIGVVDRQDVITNLLSEGFFLLWWNDVVSVSNWLPFVGEYLELGEIWQSYFWPLNIIFAAFFVLHLTVLVRGLWHRFELIFEITLDVALMAIGVILLGAQHLTTVNNADISIQFVSNIQIVVQMVIIVIMAATLWDIWLAAKTLRGQLAR